MALDSSPEAPLAVRTVANAVKDWVGRLGSVWIEGEVAEYRPRPGGRLQYLRLRDTEADVSLTVVVDTSIAAGLQPPLAAGQRILVHAQPSYWTGRGELQYRARALRAVGLGELLAQLEALRATLAAEGLFAPERKQPLPFLPRCIGLICGRNSAAQHDVQANVWDRWPGTAFEVREVAVQGAQAVPEVVAALTELASRPEIDVIVITRGGGSVEDLLPFSNETLVRAVANCRTPVVSAIGHEQDVPLLDFVADLRASTPTDAAKRIVPSWREQVQLIQNLAQRGRRSLHQRAEQMDRHIVDTRSRLRRAVQTRLESAELSLAHLQAQLQTLSPQATLDRGYAIAVLEDGSVLRDATEVAIGDRLALRLARGQVTTSIDTIMVNDSERQE